MSGWLNRDPSLAGQEPLVRSTLSAHLTDLISLPVPASQAQTPNGLPPLANSTFSSLTDPRIGAETLESLKKYRGGTWPLGTFSPATLKDLIIAAGLTKSTPHAGRRAVNGWTPARKSA